MIFVVCKSDKEILPVPSYLSAEKKLKCDKIAKKSQNEVYKVDTCFFSKHNVYKHTEAQISKKLSIS